MKTWTDDWQTVVRNVRMGGVKTIDVKWSWRYFQWGYEFEVYA